jgi:hypothetical protein
LAAAAMARIARNMGVGCGRASDAPRLGIHDQACAAVVGRHPAHQIDGEPEQLGTEAVPAHRLVDGEPRHTHDRERVHRQFSSDRFWEVDRLRAVPRPR